MKIPAIALLIAIVSPFGAAYAQSSQSESCWGQASAVFAQTQVMGEHASQQPNPRLGLRNLARALYEAGVIEDDSMSSLGVFVAETEGLSIDACLDSNVIASSVAVQFGTLYYEGMMVRTLVPPASIPIKGRDNLYVVPGQLAVAAVAPGDRDYHGGQWAFHSVTWLVAAYDLTSEVEVLEAAALGDVIITRLPENDFRCPIQP